MKYHYTEKDLDIISWNRIDNYVLNIYNDVNIFLEKNNLHIKYITPILRGGGVPAVMLSHLFNVIEMLPIQLKYNQQTKKVDEILTIKNIPSKQLKDDECILLVEGNHVTGKTAQMSVDMLKHKFGSDAKIIYVSLTRDYTYKNSVKNTIYTTCALLTNETKLLSKEECKKLGISYNLVSVFPWESIKEELYELNKPE